MPKLDDFEDISRCSYCEKLLFRGHNDRNQRPEVEHIIEVQAVVETIKNTYYDDDHIVAIPQEIFEAFCSALNSKYNLLIACGDCNLKKMFMQQRLIVNAHKSDSPYQPIDGESRLVDIVINTIVMCAEELCNNEVPVYVVTYLIMNTLSCWIPDTNSDFFISWANNFMSSISLE